MMNIRNRNALLHMLRPNRERTDWESTIDYEKLTDLMIAWWSDYKKFEQTDTIPEAYREQRLTVKGMDSVWRDDIAFKNKSGVMEPFVGKKGEKYPLDKGLSGLQARVDPTNFLPYGGGESRKTELGLHDTSTGLMSADRKISQQQYKRLDPNSSNVTEKIYVFMPLGYPEDQGLFQTLNALAKRVRMERPHFYTLVRFYRARMTRLKLAAEHDMSTNFTLAVPVGYKLNMNGNQVPKFRFSLLDKTDATKEDKKFLDEADKLKLDKGRPKQKIFTVKKTGELLAARQQAATDYRQLVLDKWRYGEVVIAYRKHEQGFPIFTMFSPNDEGFVVGTVSGSTWTAQAPKSVIPDVPH